MNLVHDIMTWTEANSVFIMLLMLMYFFFFSSKIEKEKKQQAKEVGMIRSEVSGPEVGMIRAYVKFRSALLFPLDTHI